MTGKELVRDLNHRYNRWWNLMKEKRLVELIDRKVASGSSFNRGLTILMIASD